ncbi:cytosol aminopeptidase [Halyomorpha halys]|uniref:cytosol aminopeptidase n=1 Tax=Halyomorpha halys TaxID=286706 RepID=UPI0006D4F274|nr:cytosol aminopeptidase-like [Halyomorpha halys]
MKIPARHLKHQRTLLTKRWLLEYTGKRTLLPDTGFKLTCPGTASSIPSGLVVGLYCDVGDVRGDKMKLTASGQKYDDLVKGKLKHQLKLALPPPKLGQVRTFYGLDETFNAVAVAGLGTDCVGYDPTEEMDEQKEVIRMAAGAGSKALQELSMQRIYVDSFGHSESAAEGACMGVWLYQQNKTEKDQRMMPKIELFDCGDWIGWQIGQQKANAQNLARQLMETPANLLTPSAFALSVVEVLTKSGVDVEVRCKNWAKLRQFNAFLAVSSGSGQPPVFLEVLYEGCEPDVSPIVLVGKGITFDAGGLCLKSCNAMRHTRGDMAGAAAVVAAVRAIAALQIPINVRGLIPLCENMPGACAFKPGDIIKSYNGKTILVQDTSYEGRLILADALSYSVTYSPKFIVDVGTLTTDLMDVMGSSAAAVFTNSDQLYDLMRIASIHTGDRVWRLPLWEYYEKGVTDISKSDVLNVGTTREGSACKAAAFLRQFVPQACDWIHVDTYGITRTSGKTYTYLRRGMSGRPTRTLIEFLSQLACRSS